MLCTLCCSLYAPKGDTRRVERTVEWFDNICQTAGVDFVLCLVDDDSPQSFESIKEKLTPKGHCKDVQYFESKERLGKAKQLNRLFPNVHTPFICMIDNDILLPPNWLVECIRVATIPQVGVCGVHVEQHLRPGMEHRQPTPNGDIVFHTPEMLGGACIVWNKSKLGPENYLWDAADVYGHEDAEFVQRIHRRIGMITVIPSRGAHMLPLEEDEAATDYRTWKDKVLDDNIALIKERIMYLDETSKVQ